MRLRTDRHRTRGMVTLEIAMGTIVVAVVLSVAVSVIAVVIQHSRAAEAASMIARELAQGDKQGAATARGTLPPGATETVSTSNGWVTVSVTVAASLGPLGSVTTTSTASMPIEPGVHVSAGVHVPGGS